MAKDGHLYISIALIVLALFLIVIAFIVADVSHGYDAWFWVLLVIGIILGLGALIYMGYGLFSSHKKPKVTEPVTASK